MQNAVVIIIIVLAVVYGSWRFYKTFKHGGCGCSPAEDGKEQNPGCACGGCAGCRFNKK